MSNSQYPIFKYFSVEHGYLVSGVRCQETCSPEGTIHHLRHTLLFPQLTASGVLVLELSAPMFSPIHINIQYPETSIQYLDSINFSYYFIRATDGWFPKTFS